MSSTLIALVIAAALALSLHHLIIYPLYLSPLSRVPGPKSYALTRWRLAWEDWAGRRTRTIHALHQRYGPAVRVGPNEVHFNSAAAVRAIYGAGSGFERTGFYRMFDVYGRQNLFTFAGARAHAERKKLLAHAYAKSSLLRGHHAAVVEAKVADFLDLIAAAGASKNPHGERRQEGEEEEKSGPAAVASSEIFTTLHYYSLDNITAFLYGASSAGATRALRGDAAHRALLADILDPARRRLTWFAVHLPALTRWLYAQAGLAGRAVAPLLPMRRPATYTGIRAHALQAMRDFRAQASAASSSGGGGQQQQQQQGGHDSIIATLWEHRVSDAAGDGEKGAAAARGGLTDLDIASECADHLLAGIDTTSDTLMFLLWLLSLPAHAAAQRRLVAEARAVPAPLLNRHGVPTVEACAKLPYLDAVVKETLRLHAPLPASEPRTWFPSSSSGGKAGDAGAAAAAAAEVVVDGVSVPPGVVVEAAPYSLHRNADVFPEPERWVPERWLEGGGEGGEAAAARAAEMRRWWWPFSSGGRMCIGMHLALAEMALVPAIYRKYSTRIKPGFEGVSPGITSRFEVFGDESGEKMKEHTCWIDFIPHED